MSTGQIRCEVEVGAPAEVVWAYVTDWARQGEWIPLTRVEPAGRADRVGGRIRAWTGVGPVGFWDTMTITGWDALDGGSASCEVMHTGSLVRGDGGFSVRALPGDRSVVEWWERLILPAGPLGAMAWRVLGPLTRRGVQLALRRMGRRLEGRRGPR